MRIHDDFNQPAFEPAQDRTWVPSPTPGIDRQLLDRIGDEIARATSIVRYAPNSQFPEHVHGGGEEILVLSGVFEDESGAWPAGTYLRHPRGSRHAPGSQPGCTIWVKLHQFLPDDDRWVRTTLDTVIQGPQQQQLHAHGSERVEQLLMPSGHTHQDEDCTLWEVLILSGTVQVMWSSADAAHTWTLTTHDWLRLPAGIHTLTATTDSRVLLKAYR